jgi:DnaK suppressor protein
MDDQRAHDLIRDERARATALLAELTAAGRENRSSEDHPGDLDDAAQPLTAEGADDAVAGELRDRLAALDRAEQRLRDGTYGRSVRSGRAIPDERLEADPAAELTVEEAAEDSPLPPR